MSAELRYHLGVLFNIYIIYYLSSITDCFGIIFHKAKKLGQRHAHVMNVSHLPPYVRIRSFGPSLCAHAKDWWEPRESHEPPRRSPFDGTATPGSTKRANVKTLARPLPPDAASDTVLSLSVRSAHEGIETRGLDDIGDRLAHVDEVEMVCVLECLEHEDQHAQAR